LLYLLDEDTFVELSAEPDTTDLEESLDFDVTIAVLETVLTAVGVLILTELGIFIVLLTDVKYFVKT
jgi:hypothetical protein